MHHRYKSMPILWLAIALICAPVSSAIGQSSDRDQPVVVTADRSEYSGELQQQTLTGNVVIEQGSLRINADKIVIGLVQGALDNIDASGRPATFEQLDDEGRKIKGQATRVQLSVASNRLQLLGDAVLSTPTQSLSGDRVDYNLNTQAASAVGGDEQVHIVILPVKSETQ